MIKVVIVAYVAFTFGFYGGYTFKDAEIRWDANHHKAVCDSNPKYQGHMAFDTNGDRMCFQQSKLSGRIERVSLAVRGL